MHESETWKWSCFVVSNSLRPHGLQPTRLLCPWDFPGKSTGVGCHCLLHNGHGFGWTPRVGDEQGGQHAVVHGVAKSWTGLSDWTEMNWYSGRSPWFQELAVFLSLIWARLSFSSLLLLSLSWSICPQVKNSTCSVWGSSVSCLTHSCFFSGSRLHKFHGPPQSWTQISACLA